MRIAVSLIATDADKSSVILDAFATCHCSAFSRTLPSMVCGPRGGDASAQTCGVTADRICRARQNFQKAREIFHGRFPCLCLRSHATFFGTTRPPFTTGRVLPSFGSNTPTSAGSAARNPQKFGTPLYLNAASRTVLGVSGRRACAIRELRASAAESEGDDSG